MVRLKEVRCKLKHHVMLQKLYNRSVFFYFSFYCFVLFFSFSFILMPSLITILHSKRLPMSRGLSEGLIKEKTPDGE